jgi:phosphate-selective porin
MTAKIGSATTAKVIERITGASGVNSSLAALTQADQALAGPLDAAQVRAQNVAADLAERGSTVKYPAVNVYCEKVMNRLTEKFRTFSGTVQMTIEVRHSQDRLEGLQDRLELYTDAVTQVLAAGRGDWGDGMFYGGGYEASFGAVKPGGKNFIQVAKVTFEIGVSKS